MSLSETGSQQPGLHPQCHCRLSVSLHVSLPVPRASSMQVSRCQAALQRWEATKTWNIRCQQLSQQETHWEEAVHSREPGPKPVVPATPPTPSTPSPSAQWRVAKVQQGVLLTLSDLSSPGCPF